MAEAAAALSLAANIIQVTEFGSKFVTTGWKLWHSGKEALDEDSALEPLCRNLKDVFQRLENDVSSVKFEVQSHQELAGVANQASKVAQEILESVQGIGLSSKRRKRDAARTAFKLVWKEENLKALEQRLDRLTNALVLNLAASLRSYAMQSLDTQNTILSEIQQIRAKIELSNAPSRLEAGDSSRGFGSTIVSCLSERGSQQRGALESSLRSELFGAVYHSDLMPETIPRVSPGIIVTAERRRTLQKAFLSHFHYDGMYSRAESVAKAHESTFRWIFEDDSGAGFSKWLQSSQQLYWITGKAGSGKSTLMKFISQAERLGVGKTSHDISPPRCAEHLRLWAADRPLTIACFYFWAAGSERQRSREGLYRTLLHQILSDHPEEIMSIFPERWEALCLYDEDPKPFVEEELRQGLLEVVQDIEPTAKVCLFVDGLDEFDGKHEDLIDLFNDIITKTSIKVCVASRPWTVFEDAFRTKPSLRLEVLTHDDIKNYVRLRFQADGNFVLLQKRESAFADALFEEVVDKAAGVFLWVNLVVTSLIDGMRSGDRISDLRRRLDLLPPDLEDLYETILSSLDPVYFEHAAQYFSLIRAALPSSLLALPSSLSALEFYLADELEVENPSFTLHTSKQPWNYDEVDTITEVIRRRLHSRCKGLIDTGPQLFFLSGTHKMVSAGPEVEFLHRTVRDYINLPRVQERLLAGMKSPFDPHLRLGYVSMVFAEFFTAAWREESKRIPASDQSISWQLKHRRTRRAADVFLHSVRTKPEYARHATRLLDYLEVAYNSDDDLNDLHKWWCDPGAKLDLEYFGHSFLSLAIKFGVVDYVQERIVGSRLDKLQFRSPQQASEIKDTTRSFLQRVEPGWVRIAQLMIEHGASVSRKTVVDAIHVVEKKYGFPDGNEWLSKAEEVGMLEQELRRYQRERTPLNLEFLRNLNLEDYINDPTRSLVRRIRMSRNWARGLLH
ncbi:hypothetical protein QBC40DRAFT_319724 [Triangularia verruculosa]|uniref:NACHT domain-containing protein n=1 Tax=Triangularia verruculosa TaxID=2587418 RepID=A0AAN6XSH5_9PEZI|nr:hypothetical protein QBC40DRAFT_319724 [Triangularia verruculosa]